VKCEKGNKRSVPLFPIPYQPHFGKTPHIVGVEHPVDPLVPTPPRLENAPHPRRGELRSPASLTPGVFEGICRKG